MIRSKSKAKAEFGDFQTPPHLADQICELLRKMELNPATILEPTCGVGNFLAADRSRFPSARLLGFDINANYVQQAKERIPSSEISVASFFELEWPKVLNNLPSPFLVIGNPPWVTNSELGSLESANLPKKQNFQNHKGLDALTGKSNFDISEWMLLSLMEWLAGRNAVLAMLCKTAVARKSLQYAWKNRLPISSCEMYSIDSARHFDVSVDACLLLCSFTNSLDECEKACAVYETLESKRPRLLGCVDGKLIADVQAYKDLKSLEGESQYRWRSGVKHDCRNVMEFRIDDGRLINGFGEAVDIENRYLFPMLKSSALTVGKTQTLDRWMLVTQTHIGEETASIAQHAPRTWDYLLSHANWLDRRKSTIYKNRPRFSLFGVGQYTFAPWKVGISGFYKRLEFVKIGPFQGKPVVLDDTAYFVDCHSEQEADLVCSLLNSDLAQRFYSALIFWDAKRPITVSVLRLLSIERLAQHLHRWQDLKACREELRESQLNLF
jgi:hypothetical protein